MTIARRLDQVRARIEAAAARAGREPSDVTLVAVSKTFPPEVLLEAVRAGVTDLGENRAQEFAAKRAAVGDRATWHFVGHLQTNKVRAIVGSVALIHSVDRPGLAEAISRRASALGIEQRVLIEVNVSGEASKGGIDPSEAPALARAAAALPGIEVAGLMTIPPLPDQAEEARPFYKELAALRDDIAADVSSVTALSMGMTRDYEVAIEEGATLIRVGEAIFGARN